MGKCRAFMSWYFCFFAVALFGATILDVRDAVQGRTFNHLSLRFVAVMASFLLAAIVFGEAWWSVWRKKSYGRRWAIAASLLSLLQATSMLFVGWKAFEIWFVNFNWLPTVFGVVGLIAFSRPYDAGGPKAGSTIRYADQA
jgi:hypothetical protein